MSFHDKYEARLLRVLHEEQATADSLHPARCLVCRNWSQPCPACLGRNSRRLPRPEAWSAHVAAATLRFGADLTGFALYLRRQGLAPHKSA